MTYSNTPTDFIIVNAETTSEWDICQFAIIRLNKSQREELLCWQVLAEQLSKHNDFVHMEFRYPVEGWFYDYAQDYDKDADMQDFATIEVFTKYLIDQESKHCFRMLNPDLPFAFIQMPEEELMAEMEQYVKPDQKVNTATLRIDRYGRAVWLAHGANSDEIFETPEIALETLLEAFEQEVA